MLLNIPSETKAQEQTNQTLKRKKENNNTDLRL